MLLFILDSVYVYISSAIDPDQHQFHLSQCDR